MCLLVQKPCKISQLQLTLIWIVIKLDGYMIFCLGAAMLNLSEISGNMKLIAKHII